MADLAQLINTSVALSVMLMVISLGLEATFSEATSLLRDAFRPPRRLSRATFAMNAATHSRDSPFTRHQGGYRVARWKNGSDSIGAGLLVSYLAPRPAAKMGPFISKVAFLCLILGLLPVLFTTWPQIASLCGDGTGLMVAGVLVAVIAAGQLIGGPHPGNRTASGITCAMRHPGIALTIGTTSFPKNKLLPAAVLLYILIGTILTTVSGKIRQKQTSTIDA